MPATDFDADGRADYVVYRPSTGQWFAKPSGGGIPWSVTFGASGDVAVQPVVAPGTPAHPTAFVEYYHLDALGSIRAVTGELGTVLSRHDFLPFGDEWTGAAAREAGLFSGNERDAKTGLDYFGARYYRADLGRFTTVDPIGVTSERMVDPLRLNRFTYVRNRPLVFVDPDGRYEAWMHKIITETLLRMALPNPDEERVSLIARYTGDEPGGADHWKNGAPAPWNCLNGVGSSLHFPSEAEMAKDLADLPQFIAEGTFKEAGFAMHAVEDGRGVHAAFAGWDLVGMIGHALQSLGAKLGLAKDPDKVIGDLRFINMTNALYRALLDDPTAALTEDQIGILIEAVCARANALHKTIVVVVVNQ